MQQLREVFFTIRTRVHLASCRTARTLCKNSMAFKAPLTCGHCHCTVNLLTHSPLWHENTIKVKMGA